MYDSGYGDAGCMLKIYRLDAGSAGIRVSGLGTGEVVVSRIELTGFLELANRVRHPTATAAPSRAAPSLNFIVSVIVVFVINRYHLN